MKHLQRLTLLAQRRRSCQKSVSQGSVRSFSELHTQMQSTMCMHSVQYGILYRYESYTDNVQGIFQPHSQVLSQPHSQDTSFPASFPALFPASFPGYFISSLIPSLIPRLLAFINPLHAVKGPCKHLCDHIWVDRSDTCKHLCDHIWVDRSDTCKHLCDHIWVNRSDTLLHTGHPRTHLCCMRTG